LVSRPTPVAQAFACEYSALALNLHADTMGARREALFKKRDVRCEEEVSADLLAHALRLVAHEARPSEAAKADPGADEMAVAR
jgi:hypothetical protein